MVQVKNGTENNMGFEKMNLRRELLEAVAAMGYREPTPIQKKTIPQVLQGRDVLGCAQTGTGKTAAFALPILQRLCKTGRPAGKVRPIRTLILTPTRELALQIWENFARYGEKLPLTGTVIFGGVNQNPQVETLKQGVDILVATPGRLNDLMGQGFISLDDIQIFVLDEADRMLDMGFIHDVKKVMAKLPAKRQTLLFSATMPPDVEEIAQQLLTDPVTVKVDPVTSTVDAIRQSVYFLPKENKTDLLLSLLNEGISQALVFVRTKHGADAVARKLVKNDVRAVAIHGDKSQNARQNALAQFKSGKADILVATDIAARGIDISELPCVINFNIPEEPEAYIHRIGRTGRAGLAGNAISLCCSDELDSFRDIEKLIGKKIEEKTCQWSVVDMVATKYVRPQNGQRSRDVVKTTSQAKENVVPKAEKATERDNNGQDRVKNDTKKVAQAVSKSPTVQNQAKKAPKSTERGEKALLSQEGEKRRQSSQRNVAKFDDWQQQSHQKSQKPDQQKPQKPDHQKPQKQDAPVQQKPRQVRGEVIGTAEAVASPAAVEVKVTADEKVTADVKVDAAKKNRSFLGNLLRGRSKKEEGDSVTESQPTAPQENRESPLKPAQNGSQKKAVTSISDVQAVPHRAGVPYYYEPAKRVKPSRLPDPAVEGHKGLGGGNEIITRYHRNGNGNRYRGEGNDNDSGSGSGSGNSSRSSNSNHNGNGNVRGNSTGNGESKGRSGSGSENGSRGRSRSHVPSHRTHGTEQQGKVAGGKNNTNSNSNHNRKRNDG